MSLWSGCLCLALQPDVTLFAAQEGERVTKPLDKRIDQPSEGDFSVVGGYRPTLFGRYFDLLRFNKIPWERLTLRRSGSHGRIFEILLTPPSLDFFGNADLCMHLLNDAIPSFKLE